MIENRLLIICIMLIHINFWGQEILILDEEKNPITNVAVFNSKNTKSALSNSEGFVNLSRFEKTELLTMQHPNYEEKKIVKKLIQSTVQLEKSNKLLQTINLKENKNINNITNVAEKKIFISSAEIRELNVVSTADLLEKKGGISVQKSQMGGGSPNIRGFEANKVLLMLDGVRLNNAIYRSGHLQNIITVDEYMLEDIEVIFGPSSVLYGSDALGGTINMKTKNVNFKNSKKWSGSGTSSYSSAYQGIKNSFSLSYEASKFATITNISIKKFGDLKMGSWRPHGYDTWGLIYHYVDDNGIQCNDEPEIQKGTSYSQYDFFNKSLIKINSKWRFTSNIQYSNSSNIPRFDKLNDGNVKYMYDDNGNCLAGENLEFHSYYYGPQKRLFSSLNLTGYNTYFDKSEFIVAYQKIEESRHKWYMDDYLDYVESGGENYDLPTHQYETVNVYSLNTNFRKKKLHLGSETIYNDVQSKSHSNGENIWGVGDTRYPPEGSNLFSSAIYVNILHRFSHTLQLEAGMRYTYSNVQGAYPDSMDRPVANIEGLKLSSKNHIFSGNVKILYYPSDSWKISSVTARGFHAPNVDDMLKVFKKGSILTIPNIDLKPEYSLSQEFSISKKINSNLTFYGVGFYTRLYNAIVKDNFPYEFSPNPDTTMLAWAADYDDMMLDTYANQNIDGSLSIYGATLGYYGNLLGCEINGDFNIVKGINKGLESGPIAHIPPLFGKLEITKKLKLFDLKLLCFYAGHKPADEFDEAGVDNIDETPLLNEMNGIPNWAGSPSWWTLNFYVKYSINTNFNLQFGCDNIFNAHYKTFGSGVSAPGRNLIVAINYGF
ncbi:MAG: hypothetical protein CBD51_005780 [Flavobacteriales bacterium TMED191]|nr:MAG: hypothetical protein CBD51_005780 [Flavobacteriales bacterium TMED191]